MSADVQVIGLEKLMHKLDTGVLVAPEREAIVRDASDFANGFLAGRLPTGPLDSASSLASTVAGTGSETRGTVSVARYPFVYLERGSQYPTAPRGIKRSHRRRTGVRVSELRIKPRRFLSRTMGTTRKYIASRLVEGASNIAANWSGE